MADPTKPTRQEREQTAAITKYAALRYGGAEALRMHRSAEHAAVAVYWRTTASSDEARASREREQAAAEETAARRNTLRL